jgi:hypothetical protein
VRILRGNLRQEPTRSPDCLRVRKLAVFRTNYKNRIFIMEAERINAIGSLLADLSTRTLDLRGYL